MNEIKKNNINPAGWVDNYSNYLFQYAYLRVRNEKNAQDLVSETYLSALKNVDKFMGKSSEKTWLTAILKNKIFDHFRKKYNSSSEFNDELYNEKEEVFEQGGRWDGHWIWGNGPKEWNVSPDVYVEKKEFWDYLYKCMEELPEQFLSVFTLSELEDIPSKEICKELNLTQSNLWVILHRCRKQLRRCLEIRWIGDSPFKLRKE